MYTLLLISISSCITRDCKPAKELTESYYHGACSVPLSADTIGDVLFSKDLDADKILFSSPEHNQRISIRELQRKVNFDSCSYMFLFAVFLSREKFNPHIKMWWNLDLEILHISLWMLRKKIINVFLSSYISCL